MKWINNLKIAPKLLTSFVFVALIAVLIGYIGLKDINQINQSDIEMYEHMTIPINKLMNISTNFQRLRSNSLLAFIQTNQEEKEGQLIDIENRRKEINSNESEFEKTITNGEMRNAYDSFIQIQNEYWGLLDKYIRFINMNKTEEAKNLIFGGLDTERKNYQDAISKIVKLKIDLASKKSKDNSELAQSSSTFMIIFMSFGFIAAILFGIYISRSISNPINSLCNALDKFGSGETDVEIKIFSNDEIGILFSSFEKMVEKIKQQMEHLNNLPTPVMQIDREFNIQFMNKFGAKLLQSEAKSLVGKKCYDYFKTDHCHTDKCACSQAIKNNKIVSEETISHANNSKMNIVYTGSPIKDKNENIIGALEYVTDITEIKEVQDYLKRCTTSLLSEMDKFASGDLTVNVVPEKKDDEFAKLFNGFNLAVEKINLMIINVIEAIQATASASTEISSSTEEMAAGSQEQSQQAEEVASAVEEMTKTILETTNNAGKAAEVSNNYGNIAKEGGNVVNETINGMNRISDVVKKSAGTVQQLGRNSEQIGEIVQVIDDIADQTNLLALNAAIEAARAGEQGRGFAVVADEVRKLAERTTKATKEIASMIKQIQRDTEDAVNAMQQGTEEVENGRRLADKAGNSLKQIISGAENVVEIITQVAAASEQQSATSEQISKNIDAISSVTQQSAAGVQQIARAAEDLNRLTNNLENLISKFKISGKINSEKTIAKKVNNELAYSQN